MPDTAVAEADVWAYLQVDLMPIFNTPVDQAFIKSLIVAAEHRIETFCGTHPLDMEEIPPNIAAAINLDVGTYYFNRLDPVLPSAWDEMISPNRKWRFGGAVAEEDAT